MKKLWYICFFIDGMVCFSRKKSYLALHHHRTFLNTELSETTSCSSVSKRNIQKRANSVRSKGLLVWDDTILFCYIQDVCLMEMVSRKTGGRMLAQKHLTKDQIALLNNIRTTLCTDWTYVIAFLLQKY